MPIQMFLFFQQKLIALGSAVPLRLCRVSGFFLCLCPSINPVTDLKYPPTGGDFDGDTAFVTWDQRLIPQELSKEEREKLSCLSTDGRIQRDHENWDIDVVDTSPNPVIQCQNITTEMLLHDFCRGDASQFLLGKLAVTWRVHNLVDLPSRVL